MTFDGLMSRCTTPQASAAARARAACSIHPTRPRVASGHRGGRALRAFRLRPFHRVETLAILFAVICHPSHIWMTIFCSRTRFAQKTGPRARILRDLAIDDLEGNKRVQNCIARAISYRHCARTEFHRKTVCSCLYLEVGVSQWSGC